MFTQIKDKKFILFVNQTVVMVSLLAVIVVSINYFVDASEVIRPGQYSKMAELSLAGNIVATTENYNERLYQVAVVNTMDDIPETVVIGCSRGMYLGEEITGYKNLYNNCVSGACMEDYYALLGLYYRKFSKIPSRVIIELSPWIFYKDNPESRWTEQQIYSSAAGELYEKINGKKLKRSVSANNENPYFSIAYFQHNLKELRRKGTKAFIRENVRISTNTSEAADLSDGSIRYNSKVEKANSERLSIVKATKGAVTYQNVNKMNEIDNNKKIEYENLLNFLFENNIEVIMYMQPFSVTQCRYIYDERKNLVFSDVENYLHELEKKYGIKIIGGFDARNFNIADENFIDFMHLDKAGTKIVWNTK